MSDETEGDAFESQASAQELLKEFEAGLTAVVGAMRDAIGAAEATLLGSGDEIGVLTWLGRLDALLEELGDHDGTEDDS